MQAGCRGASAKHHVRKVCPPGLREGRRGKSDRRAALQLATRGRDSLEGDQRYGENRDRLRGGAVILSSARFSTGATTDRSKTLFTMVMDGGSKRLSRWCRGEGVKPAHEECLRWTRAQLRLRVRVRNDGRHARRVHSSVQVPSEQMWQSAGQEQDALFSRNTLVV